MSFDSAKDFRDAIDALDPENPVITKGSSSFVSAEDMYERGEETVENEAIGFLLPDKRYRHVFNKDLEIIVDDTLYKATKHGTLYAHVSNKSELLSSLDKMAEFKTVSDREKAYGDVRLIDTYGLWTMSASHPITDEVYFDDDDDDDGGGGGSPGSPTDDDDDFDKFQLGRDTKLPRHIIESFPVVGTSDVNIVNKILHFNPKYLGHQKIRFKSNRKRKLYVSVYRNDYGVGVSIGIDCKVMKKQWYGRWTHVRNWGHGIYYGIPELVVKQSIKVPNYNNKFTPNLKKILNDQWKKSMAYDDFAKASASLGGGIINQWDPEYNQNPNTNKYLMSYVFDKNHSSGVPNPIKSMEDELIKGGAKFLKRFFDHKKQAEVFSYISEPERSVYRVFRNDVLWNGGGYHVRKEYLNYRKKVIFNFTLGGSLLESFKGLDIGDDDYIGAPSIVSCDAIVYTNDGDGWIGARIQKAN